MVWLRAGIAGGKRCFLEKDFREVERLIDRVRWEHWRMVLGHSERETLTDDMERAVEGRRRQSLVCALDAQDTFSVCARRVGHV